MASGHVNRIVGRTHGRTDQYCTREEVLANAEPSTHGPSVWTGRALQAENGDLEKLVLRFCIRPIDEAFELLAIMDIRARSISFTSRPRRPDGPPDHERAGETFLHLLFRLQTSVGKPTQQLFWGRALASVIPPVSVSGCRLREARLITAFLRQHRPGDLCQLVGESCGQNVGMEALSGASEPDPEAGASASLPAVAE